MTGLEVAVGFLITWVIKKAGRAGKRADEIVDDAVDAALDRVHRVVIEKLGGDSSLTRMQAEASESGQVAERTRTRVQLALEDAVQDDPQFAERLQAAVDAAREAGAASTVNQASQRGIVVGRDNSGIASTGDNAVNIQRR